MVVFRTFSIDPSAKNTGLVCWEGEQMAWAGTYPARAIPALLKEKLQGTDPQRVRFVVERPPRATSRSIDSVETIGGFYWIVWSLEEQGYAGSLSLVSPGQWKPVAKLRRFNVPKALQTQHERDAFCMGLVCFPDLE